MFDKEKFRNTIKKALGDRTITEYSNESGVNRTYLSKYVNKRLDSPPSPDILKRLADYAQNNITYEEFMKVAGYLEKNQDLDNQNSNIKVNYHDEKVKYIVKELYKAGIIEEGKEPDQDLIETFLEIAKTTAKAFKKKK